MDINLCWKFLSEHGACKGVYGYWVNAEDKWNTPDQNKFSVEGQGEVEHELTWEVLKGIYTNQKDKEMQW